MITTELKPPRNWSERAKRLERVMEAIIDNPEYHDQTNWHCGTSHCFAGTSQLIARRISIKTCVDSEDNQALNKICKQFKVPIILGNSNGIQVGNGFEQASEDAQKWLGLTDDEAIDLFSGGNTLPALKRKVKELSKPQVERKSLKDYLEDSISISTY
jgi:hypothetical protein